MGKSCLLSFHPRGNALCPGGPKTISSRTVVVLSRRHIILLRLALSPGRYQYPLARRDHSHRRFEFPSGLGMADVQAISFAGLKLENAALTDSLKLIESVEPVRFNNRRQNRMAGAGNPGRLFIHLRHTRWARPNPRYRILVHQTRFDDF